MYNIPLVDETLVISRDDFSANVKVDVSKWVAKKASLSYIPWGVALGLLRSYNANLYVGFVPSKDGHPYHVTEQGVYILAYVFDKTTGKKTPPLFHAVRGYNNKADTAPTIDTIQNQMQRAFAKAIAMETGLGWSLYSKMDESIDFDDDETYKPKAQQPAKAQAATANGALKKTVAKDEDW